MSRPLIAAFSAAAVLALLTACAPGGETDPSESVLRVGILDSPTCLDPAQSATVSQIYTIRSVVDSLTDQDPDTGEIVPWIATDWDINDDATEYVFHLREGVTFSDGEALDAAAVVVNLDATAVAASSAADAFASYAGAEAVDDTTVVVRFSEPNASFLQATSLPQLGLLSPAVIVEDAEKRCDSSHLVGSGPFTLASVTADQEIVLERRDDYDWPSDAAQHSGAAGIERVQIQIVPEASNRTGLLQQGSLDVIAQVQPTDEETLADAGFTVLSRSGPGIVPILYPNLERPLPSDPAVQQALQKSIDREEIADTILTESYEEATSVLSSSTPGWTDLSGLLAYDPDGAEAVLDEAGWTEGPDGIRERDGERLSLDFHLVTDWIEVGQADAELLQQQLAKVGIELRITPLPIADWQTVFSSGEWDFFAGNLTRADADVLRSFFSVSAQNLANSPEAGDLEPLLLEQGKVADIDERNALLVDAQRVLLEQGYAYPLHEQPQVVATSAQVSGLRFDSASRLSFYGAEISD